MKGLQSSSKREIITVETIPFPFKDWLYMKYRFFLKICEISFGALQNASNNFRKNLPQNNKCNQLWMKRQLGVFIEHLIDEFTQQVSSNYMNLWIIFFLHSLSTTANGEIFTSEQFQVVFLRIEEGTVPKSMYVTFICRHEVADASVMSAMAAEFFTLTLNCLTNDILNVTFKK